MADPARIASLTAALADALAANTTTVAWRTLAAEASARGFPTARAFREWCQRTGVTIREAGGVALVAVPARAAWGGAEVRSAAPRASIGAAPLDRGCQRTTVASPPTAPHPQRSTRGGSRGNACEIGVREKSDGAGRKKRGGVLRGGYIRPTKGESAAH